MQLSLFKKLWPSKKHEALQCDAEKLYFRSNIKERRMNSKTYQNCWIGYDAISLILELKIATNVEEALKFGTNLIEAEIIRHVDNEQTFKDDKKSLYTFTRKFHRERKAHSRNPTIQNQQQSNSNKVRYTYPVNRCCMQLRVFSCVKFKKTFCWND